MCFVSTPLEDVVDNHAFALPEDSTPSNLRSTSELADRVSSKIQDIDLAQSRVSHTLLLIDAIVDRRNCPDGVVKALASDDFESAANYIQTDTKHEDSGSDEREKLLAYKKHLEGIVRKRLSAAFLEEEGLQVYVSYLKKVIAMRFRVEFEQLVEQASSNQDQVNFVACLTNLFKDIILAIEENDEILRSLCGENAIVYAICELQEESDSRPSLIFKKYLDYRKLGRLASEINSYNSNLLSIGVEGPDPREIEFYLEEMLSLAQLGEDYVEYMVSKIRGLSSVDPKLGPRATEAFRRGNFSKLSQDVIGH
ncbi:hypothetical protein Vadar_032845 [Vaccinium darrowii]|uniref:Uncharacterized protein n=1 Tax=Vaccinium darrowii TaxID=229202 RepID=A0ACB7ZFS2_9ERIC|nr:hypothetical protein Vadar_032845 [Vaccinium darrowii]